MLDTHNISTDDLSLPWGVLPQAAEIGSVTDVQHTENVVNNIYWLFEHSRIENAQKDLEIERALLEKINIESSAQLNLLIENFPYVGYFQYTMSDSYIENLVFIFNNWVVMNMSSFIPPDLKIYNIYSEKTKVLLWESYDAFIEMYVWSWEKSSWQWCFYHAKLWCVFIDPALLDKPWWLALMLHELWHAHDKSDAFKHLHGWSTLEDAGWISAIIKHKSQSERLANAFLLKSLRHIADTYQWDIDMIDYIGNTKEFIKVQLLSYKAWFLLALIDLFDWDKQKLQEMDFDRLFLRPSNPHTKRKESKKRTTALDEVRRII